MNKDIPFNDQWAEYIDQWHTWCREDPLGTFSYAKTAYCGQFKHWFLAILNYLMENMEMTRSKGKQAKKQDRGQSWTTFVDISLGDVTPADVMAKYSKGDALRDGVATLINTGHKVTLSYNPQNDVVTASATGKAGESLNEGMTLTAFAPDWVSALNILCYKHFDIAGEDWNTAMEENPKPRFG